MTKDKENMNYSLVAKVSFNLFIFQLGEAGKEAVNKTKSFPPTVWNQKQTVNVGLGGYKKTFNQQWVLERRPARTVKCSLSKCLRVAGF